MKTMKVAVFNGVKDIQIEEAPLPQVYGAHILIKVNACAICTWEQRVYTGVKEVVFPFIGGHEIAGEVVAIGEGVNDRIWEIGDQVVYGTNLACGDCYQCKSGNEQNCYNFDHSKQLPGLPHKGMGGFSEYLLVEPKHLFKYWNVSAIEASLSEPLSCVIHSCETADISYGDTVVIIGCGIMGLLHLQVALKSGASVIVSDPQEERLELAKTLGAHHTVNPSKENLEVAVDEITQQIGAQVVFDTTPIAAIVEQGLALLANNGKLVLYSSFYPDKPVTFSPDTIHKTASQIQGTANSNSRDFMRAAKMISEGIVDMTPFISQTYGLEAIQTGLESAIIGDKYRVVINFMEGR
ncbi:zinc-dependent alcohol dehydrogenase [Vagococcus allomyrinae]|nr:zinc-binding dehydrogenase [Vagococcus allomyrinae]